MIKSFSCTNFRNVNVSDLKFSRMPQRLNPENVAAICTHYFSKNYMALKTFQV